MRNLLLIQVLAIGMSLTMVAEISLYAIDGAVITMEADSEMEHEENSEKEKEKTTGEDGFMNDSDWKSSISIIFTTVENPLWTSPFLELMTPPPDLA